MKESFPNTPPKEDDNFDPKRRELLGNILTIGGATALGGVGLFLRSQHEEKTPERETVQQEERHVDTTEHVEVVPDTNPFDEIFAYGTEAIPEITTDMIIQSMRWWEAQHLDKKGKYYNGFVDGLKNMKQYDDEIKNIFYEEGCTPSLRFIAIPESYWELNPKNRKNGDPRAVGAYQIIKSTGKDLYKMRIDSEVDERKDPLKSARVAAKVLADNYKHLKSIDLAVLAYNKNLIWKYAKQCRKNGEEITVTGFMNHLAQQIDTIRSEIKNNPNIAEAKKEELFKAKIEPIKENLNYHPKFGGIAKAIKKILYADTV